MPKTTKVGPSAEQREVRLQKDDKLNQDSDVSVIISWRNDHLTAIETKDHEAKLRIAKKSRKKLVSGDDSLQNTDTEGNVPTVLKCLVCEKVFERTIHYERHITLHKIWCQRRRKSDEQLFFSYFHSARKYFLSCYLKRLTDIKGIRLARKLYQTKYNSAAELRIQYKRHFDGSKRQGIARSIKCTHCVSISYTWLSWKLHKAFHKVTRCPMCNRHFTSRYLYRIHQIGHNKNSTSAKSASRPDTKVEGSDRRKNTCPICKKSFSSKSCLNRHQRVHTGEKPYKCQECGELFRESITLRKHIAKHTGVPLPRKHKCDLCGKAFALSSVLHQHLRSHGEKNFECKHCKKFFTHQKILDRHLMTHKAEKQFHCDRCDKKFMTKSNMKRHAKTHDSTNSKPFCCKKCDKRFWQAGNLKTHIRVHTKEKPFKCESCNRCFSQRSNLNHHMRVHKGSIARKCRVCRKEFKNLDELHNHEVEVHNKPSASDIAELNSSVTPSGDVSDGHPRASVSLHKERKIACQKCGKEFHDASEYIRHLQSNSDRCGVTSTQADSREISQTIPIQNRFETPISLLTCPETLGPSLLTSNIFTPDMFSYGNPAQSFVTQPLYIAHRGTSNQLGTFNKGYLVQLPTPLTSQTDEDSASAQVYNNQHTM